MKTKAVLMGLASVLCLAACKRNEYKPCECKDIPSVAYNQTIYPDLYFGMDMAQVRQILSIDTAWLIAEDTFTAGGTIFCPGDTIGDYFTTYYCGLKAVISIDSTWQGKLESFELRIPYNASPDSIQIYRKVWKEAICDIYGAACSDRIRTTYGWIDVGTWSWSICSGPSCSHSTLGGGCVVYNLWGDGEDFIQTP